jgi:broad specificity phosphatase PhoE
MTSTLKRCIDTVKHINIPVEPINLKFLDELNAGIADGLSIEEFKNKYPEEYEERKRDKLRYRYPRGESYVDLI